MYESMYVHRRFMRTKNEFDHTWINLGFIDVFLFSGFRLHTSCSEHFIKLKCILYVKIIQT